MRKQDQYCVTMHETFVSDSDPIDMLDIVHHDTDDSSETTNLLSPMSNDTADYAASRNAKWPGYITRDRDGVPFRASYS